MIYRMIFLLSIVRRSGGWLTVNKENKCYLSACKEERFTFGFKLVLQGVSIKSITSKKKIFSTYLTEYINFTWLEIEKVSFNTLARSN